MTKPNPEEIEIDEDNPLLEGHLWAVILGSLVLAAALSVIGFLVALVYLVLLKPSIGVVLAVALLFSWLIGRDMQKKASGSSSTG